MTETSFRGEILVASRIVDNLSSGLYETPAACLKELVNNSYDADARHVRVFVKPDADRIIISDDGAGLDRAEFERHFSKISESHKRDDSDTTPSGRPKVGKIGIGFIAANELCDVMEISSTKRGSTELLNVRINFSEMRLDPAQRHRRGDDYAKGDYEGQVTETDIGSHFTHIFLTGVRGEAREILAGAERRGNTGRAHSLYGLLPKSVVARLRGGSYASWQDLDLYSQTMLEVGLNVPVEYAPDWCPADVKPCLRSFESLPRRLDFKVTYDGTDLRKPTVLGTGDGSHLVRTFSFRGRHVSARGYLFAQHGTLKPRDLRGLLVRIRNAAVGGYDDAFLGFPSATGQLFQRWISAEVWADDGLEDAMNIDRKTLRVTHPAYLELQEKIHSELTAFLGQVRRSMWATRSEERKKTEAAGQAALLSEVVARVDFPLTRRERRAIGEAFAERPEARARDRRPVLRQFSVAELYDIVLEVAAEHMEPAQFRQFTRQLTNRLRDAH